MTFAAMSWVSDQRMKLKRPKIILWDEGYSPMPWLWSKSDELQSKSQSRRLGNGLFHRALPGSHRKHSPSRVEHIPTASSTLDGTPCRIRGTEVSPSNLKI